MFWKKNETIDNLRHQALLRLHLQDYSSAEALYKRALLLTEKIHGLEHEVTASILIAMSYVYAEQSCLVLAEAVVWQALKIYENVFGTEHILIATALKRLTSIYKAQQKYADSERMIKRAIALEENFSAPPPFSLHGSYWLYVQTLRAMGRENEADEMEECKKTLVTAPMPPIDHLLR